MLQNVAKEQENGSFKLLQEGLAHVNPAWQHYNHFERNTAQVKTFHRISQPHYPSAIDCHDPLTNVLQPGPGTGLSCNRHPTDEP